MENSESRYKVERINNNHGIIISGENRTTIQIDFANTKFEIKKLNDKWSSSEFGLFEFHNIINTTCSYLMDIWKPTPIKTKRGTDFVPKKLRDWALTKTKKALAKRISEQLRKFHDTADPNIVDVHRSVFAATSRCSELIKQESLYGEANKYLVADIKKYRAACLATFHMNEYISDDDYEEFNFRPNDNRLKTSEYYKNKNWMDYYGDSHNGSLRRTLMGLPGGLPYHLVPRFININFKQPITNRLALLALLSANRNIDCIQFSSRAEIKKAIQVYAEHKREQPKLRKAAYIAEAIGFITDFPDEHNGNVVGLTAKSIDYHRNINYENKKRYSSYTANQLTAVPPIPFPAKNEIKFLSTVGEIWDIGSDQGHCLSTYDSKAVKGQCYLFFVEYNNETATVEVDPQSCRVVQSKGKRNQKNSASAWAERELNKWAGDLAGKVRVQQNECKYVNYNYDYNEIEELIPF